jgi:uncharacterized protein (DUF1697 family)
MTVYISLLRGVNVGGHNKIKMDALREVCGSLKLQGAQTYVQSGNVVFRTTESDERALAQKIQSAINNQCGFAPEIMLRTLAEIRTIVAVNPFKKCSEVPPNKLAVSFLQTAPSTEVKAKLSAIEAKEELHVVGRELFIYFPDGMGRSKLAPMLDRILKAPATVRNWNTVTKLLEMAEAMQK